MRCASCWHSITFICDKRNKRHWHTFFLQPKVTRDSHVSSTPFNQQHKQPPYCTIHHLHLGSCSCYKLSPVSYLFFEQIVCEIFLNKLCVNFRVWKNVAPRWCCSSGGLPLLFSSAFSFSFSFTPAGKFMLVKLLMKDKTISGEAGRETSKTRLRRRWTQIYFVWFPKTALDVHMALGLLPLFSTWIIVVEASERWVHPGWRNTQLLRKCCGHRQLWCLPLPQDCTK